MCCPAIHGTRTFLHLSALVSAENDEPTMHAAHCRSLEAVASAEIPKPGPQALAAVHAWLPFVALNVAGAQDVHVRSLDSVAALLLYLPAAHAPLTGVHCPPLVSCEYETPSLHKAQVRSLFAVPAMLRPAVAGHVLHGSQASL